MEIYNEELKKYYYVDDIDNVGFIKISNEPLEDTHYIKVEDVEDVLVNIINDFRLEMSPYVVIDGKVVIDKVKEKEINAIRKEQLEVNDMEDYSQDELYQELAEATISGSKELQKYNAHKLKKDKQKEVNEKKDKYKKKGGKE